MKKAQPSKAPPSKAAQLKTERIVHEDLARLRERVTIALAAMEAASEAVNVEVNKRLDPLRAQLRTLIPAMSRLDALMVQQHAENVGVLPDGDHIDAREAIDAARPHAPGFDTDGAVAKLLAGTPSALAVERATAELYDCLKRRGEGLHEAILAAEKAAQTAFQKLGKGWSAHIESINAQQRRVNQKILNLQAARVGRPLPFAGTGTSQEVHDEAKRLLGIPVDYSRQAVAMVAELDIQVALPPPGLTAEEIIDDEIAGE